MQRLDQVTDLKDLIGEGLKKSRKLKEVYIKIYWKDIVGELSKRAFPQELKGDTLTVLCESSIISHHLNLNKEKIIEGINRVIKENYVRELRFNVGSLNKCEMNLFGGEDE